MNTLQHSRAGGSYTAHRDSLPCRLSLTVPAGLGKAVKGSEGELESTGGTGRRVWWHWSCGRRDPEWEESQRQAGRIRAVQWEASPKGGMEGVAGGVDKMSRL